LLQAIANQAAIAIWHTTLIEKFHEMREALAARKLMERAKG
jgi:phage regulator Rha-like protein